MSAGSDNTPYKNSYIRMDNAFDRQTEYSSPPLYKGIYTDCLSKNFLTKDALKCCDTVCKYKGISECEDCQGQALEWGQQVAQSCVDSLCNDKMSCSECLGKPEVIDCCSSSCSKLTDAKERNECNEDCSNFFAQDKKGNHYRCRSAFKSSEEGFAFLDSTDSKTYLLISLIFLIGALICFYCCRKRLIS